MCIVPPRTGLSAGSQQSIFNTNCGLGRKSALIWPLEWHLVHPADLSAFFAQQEKTMRAMDQVMPSAELDKVHSGVEDLSLKSINEGTSQVVRLGTFDTLYDAHKSQASDIHLGNDGRCAVDQIPH
jgi:type II secretory ATPase GspE/PulE/Tfp pilus assembly ATPase PilB-like protein